MARSEQLTANRWTLRPAEPAINPAAAHTERRRRKACRRSEPYLARSVKDASGLRKPAVISEPMLNLAGDFDGSAFLSVRSFLQTATTSDQVVVLDFRNVRHCQPVALVSLFELLAGLEVATVRIRGLCQQHYLLLNYLGFTGREGQPHEPSSRDQ